MSDQPAPANTTLQQPAQQPQQPTASPLPTQQPSMQQTPPPPASSQQQQIPSSPQQPSPSHTHKPIHITLITIIGILILIAGVLGYMIFTKSVNSTPLQSEPLQTTNEPQDVTPTPPIVDTAPATPMTEKSKVLVHHADSTFTVFLVPSSAIDTFTKALPKGDAVTSVTPAK